MDDEARTKLFAMPIADLEISVRLHNALRNLHCVTIGDAMSVDCVRLRSMPGAGRKTWNELHGIQDDYRKPSPEHLRMKRVALQQELNFQVQVLLRYGATVSRLTFLQETYDSLARASEEITHR